jgi:SAM-dependent methyltransferase
VTTQRLPFGQFAAEYNAGRPGYPDADLDRLLEEQRGLVVELGAGSGKLTELAARCTALLAVEPDTSVLQHLRERPPEVPAVQGSAEKLPVATGSVQTPDPYLFGMLSAMQELAKVYVHFACMAWAILEAGARHRLEPDPGGGSSLDRSRCSSRCGRVMAT